MKYVLVTGGANGIGKMICDTLANKGYTVFACDIQKNETNDLNSKIISMYMDITNEDSITNAFNEISKTTNKLDALVNCAGIMLMASLVETDIKNTEKVMNINLFGMMRVNKIFFPMIKEAMGRIVTIGSEVGWMSASPFSGPYTISKHAVNTYNDTLRRELIFLGIKVINIQPGSFKTNIHDDTRKTFENLKSETVYFKNVISKMETTMEKELNNFNDPAPLMKSVVDAIEKKNPKIDYKIKNSILLKIINLFPEKVIDSIFFKFLK